MLSSITLLCGCNSQSKEEERFVGTWETNTSVETHVQFLFTKTFVFFSDGTTSMSNGRYEVKDGKIVISSPTEGIKRTFDYSFSDDDKILKLTIMGSSAKSCIYTKQ